MARPIQVSVNHGGREYAAHPAGRGHFPCEPGPEISALGQVGPDHLDGDVPPAR